MAVPDPTWLECWPEILHAHSFPGRARRCTLPEAAALGWHNGIRRHRFPAPGPEDLAALAAGLDEDLASLPAAPFVRLGSRSPKDTAAALLSRGRAGSGQAVLKLLTAGSLRMAVDLDRCLRSGYAPWIYLRTWQPIPWHDEFRAFVRDRRVIGVSQYFHTSEWPASPGAAETIRVYARRLQDGLQGLLPLLHLPDVVVDVALDARAEGGLRLIELNPWGDRSDAGLFLWNAAEFDGCLRIRTRQGSKCIPME